MNWQHKSDSVIGPNTLVPLSLYLSYTNIWSDHGCQFGLAASQHVGLYQRSYSTSGPVSAWTGDRLRTGKPPRRRTWHPGLLSLGQTSVGKRMSTKHKLREQTGTSRDTLARIRDLTV